MADFLVGDVVARLRADTAQFAQALNDVIARLGQLTQATAPLRQGQTQSTQATQQQTQAYTQLARTTQAVDASLSHLQQTTTQLRAQHAQSLQATQQATQAYTQLTRAAQAAGRSLSQLQQPMQQVQQAQQQAATSSRAMGSALQTAFAVAGGIGIATSLTAVVASLRQTVTESIRLAAQMQDLTISFRAMEGSAAGASRTFTLLFETAQRLGVEFVPLAEGFRRLNQSAQGSGLQGEQIRAVFENVVAGARVMGVSSEQLQRTFVTLGQILSKGVLQAEEFRGQLAENIPGALQRLASGLGITTKQFEEMVALGILPAELSVLAFAKGMGDLAKAQEPVERLSELFARLKNETTAWMAAMGEGLGTALTPFLEMVKNLSQELRALFKIPIPGTQTVPQGNPQSPLYQAFPFLTRPTGLPQPTGAVPYAASPYDALIQQQAARIQFDPTILSQLVRQESGFNPRAVSPAGAAGLGQLMPATGREFGLATPQDFYDPAKNLTAAADVLQQYRTIIREKFGTLAEETKLLLAAYNAGIGNVTKAITASQAAGEQATFAQVLPRLPKPSETGPYVARITGTTTPTTAATPRPALPEIDPFAKIGDSIDEMLKSLALVEKSMTNLQEGGRNIGGILDDSLNKQAQAAIEKFTKIATFFAVFPEQAARLTPIQREQLDLAARQALALNARVDQEKSTAAEARQRVQVLRQFEEQLAREQEQAQAQLPTMEALLGRAGTLARRPDENVAEEARSRAQQQFVQLQADVEKALNALADSPALQRLGPTLEARFKDILAQIPQAMQAEGQQAFDRVIEQTYLDPLRRLAEAYGVSKEATDLDTASKLAAHTVGTAHQAQAEAYLKTIKAVAEIEAQLPQLRRDAELSAPAGIVAIAQVRATESFEGDLASRLAQLRAPREDRESLRLRRRAERENIDLTPELEQQLRLIDEQTRWNGLISEAERLGDQAAQTITNGLLSIVDGTVAVSDGFKSMAKSILDSIAQITLNEGFRSLIRLGIGVAVGALAGGAAGATSRGGFSNVGPSAGGGATGFEVLLSQHGAVVHKPTMAMIGEGPPQTLPEYVLNRQQMDHLITAAMRDGAHSSRPVALQHGGIVNRPTMAMLGENPAHNPETVLNRQQMQRLLTSGPSAGGQAVNVTTILVDSRAKAEQVAAQERSLGRQVIIQEVVNELSQGAGSKIGQVLRSTLR